MKLTATVLLLFLVSVVHSQTWPVHIEAESYSTSYGVSVTSTIDGSGTDDVVGFSSGDSLSYSISIPTTGIYSLKFRARLPESPAPSGVFTIKKAGNYYSTVTIKDNPNSLDYQDYYTDILLPSGSYSLTFYSGSNDFKFNWFEISPSNLLVRNVFEDDNVTDLNDWVAETCNSNTIVYSTTYARSGSKTLKFTLNKTDSPCVHAELHRGCEADNERWYGFSTYMKDWSYDPLGKVVFQLHDYPDFDKGENWRSPPIGLYVQYDTLYLKVLYSAAEVNTNATATEVDYNLGHVTANQWDDWVFHIKFAYNSTGILEVWKNGTQKVARYGANSYNDEFFPYQKFGIYEWGWNGYSQYSSENTLVLYVDDFRVGNGSSSYSEVCPGPR